MTFDVAQVRAQFPALRSDAVFFDNPGGTQVAARVVERMGDYLLRTNANHGGAFKTSADSDEVVHQAHAAVADFLGAAMPDEIVFGANMTTLTFALSRALGKRLGPGDEIVVTRLDHDANISPWLQMAEDRGATVRWVDLRPQDCTLVMEDFEAQITEHTKIVACGYASNAVGTINDVRLVVELAHAAGALCFVDAVQYAPHAPIDVRALGCDFLACSAYKFFGPHVGALYGRYELLDEIKAYKVRPAPAEPPGKFETGTGNFEGYAGTLGALEYLQWIGETFGARFAKEHTGRFQGRALKLKQAMSAIRDYERGLSEALLDVLEETPGVTIHGITDRRRLAERVPTVSFTLKGQHPRRVAEALNEAGIYVWDGNYYALAVTERLGLEESGGMVRVGPVHYNTVEEIERLGKALGKIAGA
jgi:cysteine desulfurase family protein (TIGR01976 family)